MAYLVMGIIYISLLIKAPEMKFLVIVFAVFCSSCSALDTALQNAISFGDITELNKYSPEVDKQLFIRLFQSPVYVNNCFKETHGVCKYKYFLSVSTFDENPETNIYTLSTNGEVDKVTWGESADIDTAKIGLVVNKYTQAALNNNNELVNEKLIVNLVVTPKQISESLISQSN